MTLLVSLWDESLTVNKVVFVIESSVFIFTAKMKHYNNILFKSVWFAHH